MKKRLVRLTLSLAVAGVWQPLLLGQSTSPVAATQSDQTGPLRVHVTAVQGQAQYRVDSGSKWQMVVAGLDTIEGVEFRTGPKGIIQFTVGTDQVYRVDRLTVAKILRASLMADGTIRTDVGMTYGRVSKDVDLPSHPHQDTIVSPSSTLAVRGTRVSLYDQPPYQVEAVSLTGAAVFQNLHGQLVQFGAKNAGTAKVNGDSTGAAQYRLQNIPVDPEGGFAARNPAEQTLLASLNGLSGTQLGVFQNIQAIIAGQTFADKFTVIVGTLPQPGVAQFPIIWFSSTPATVVDLTVISPLGGEDFVSPSHQISSPSGGRFVSGGVDSNIANGTFGQEEADFGKLDGGTYPAGTYTITETLQGTATQSLAQNPTVSVKTQTFPKTGTPGKLVNATGASATLSATDPSVTYTITVPFTNGTPLSGGQSSEPLTVRRKH